MPRAGVIIYSHSKGENRKGGRRDTNIIVYSYVYLRGSLLCITNINNIIESISHLFIEKTGQKSPLQLKKCLSLRCKNIYNIFI